MVRKVKLILAVSTALAVGTAGQAFAADANTTAGTTTQHLKTRTPNEGLTVAAQGGVAGYSGSLGPRMDRGAAWGALIGAQATPIVGLELDYLGANNGVKDPALGGGRVVRNSGNVDVKLAIVPGVVEPYIFGGIGLTRLTVSGNQPSTPGAGFRAATTGQVPVGAGINLHLGGFTAGARVAYQYLLMRTYAPEDARAGLSVNTWNGQLLIGATF